MNEWMNEVTTHQQDMITFLFFFFNTKKEKKIYFYYYTTTLRRKGRRKKKFLIWNVERPTTNNREKKTKIKFLFKCSFYHWLFTTRQRYNNEQQKLKKKKIWKFMCMYIVEWWDSMCLPCLHKIVFPITTERCMSLAPHHLVVYSN